MWPATFGVVTDVALDPQFLLDQAVQSAQIAIGKVLRGQTANRQAAAQRTPEGTDNGAQQFQQPSILEAPRQACQQPVVEDAVEVFPYVELEEVPKAPGIGLGPLQGGDPPTAG